MQHRAVRVNIILFAIIFVQGFFLLFSKQQIASQEPKEYKIEAKEDESWPERVVGDPVALFTLVLAGFTGGLYLATRALWTSTDNLARGAEDTARRQLRAYVGIRSAQVSERDGGGSAVAILVEIENFGQTPAKSCLVNIAWTDQRQGHDIRPEHVRGLPASPENEASLMPRATREVRRRVARVPLSFSAITGRIDYEDIFGQAHFTNFRLLSRVGSDGFAPDEFGNDSN